MPSLPVLFEPMESVGIGVSVGIMVTGVFVTEVFVLVGSDAGVSVCVAVGVD